MKKILIFALFCAALTAQQPCYAPDAIPDNPVGVDNPRDLANGTFVVGKSPGEKLDLYGLSGRDFRDMLLWSQEAISGVPFCVEFYTPRSFDPGVGGQGDRPAVTMMVIRHRTQRAHIMERHLSAPAFWVAPHAGRIEIADHFAHDSRVSGKYYPGFDLRHPATPSPVGEEWLDHPHYRSNGAVFRTTATFDASTARAGTFHKQLEAQGDIVTYRLRRRHIGGFFWFGGTQEWYWQYEAYSDQNWQPGDERKLGWGQSEYVQRAEIRLPVFQPPLRRTK